MENTVFEMIQKIKETSNPILKASSLSFYISDGLRNQKLGLYEAYLLQWEVINNTREWYMLPAWSGKVQISTCIALLNQKLLAHAFRDSNCISLLRQWGMEASEVCAERRSHYIMDRYPDYLDIDREQNEHLLKEMLNVRQKYDTLSYDDGPYHVEIFPYHYFAPEEILLEKMDMSSQMSVTEEVETILMELNI
ncbi:MAG: hypothetical protein K2N95_02020 [Lachnospiraceae bacterium]|nr:hypothetical protein [Lachnospiraceae bacterium]